MGASVKKIRQNNHLQFLTDVKRVRDIMIYARTTQSFFKTTKQELLAMAEDITIKYYMTNIIFTNGRTVMVVV